MKKITVLLTITVAALLSVGCSSLSTSNPVSADNPPHQEMAAVSVTITIPPLALPKKESNGDLAKALAQPDYTPAYIVLKDEGNDPADTFTDVITITGGQTTITKSYNVVRKMAYLFDVNVYSGASNYWPINQGRVSGTVPDSANFSVSITCPAVATPARIIVQLAGTPAASIANRAQFSWTQTDGTGEPVNGVDTNSFVPGSINADTLYGLIYLRDQPNPTPFTFYLIVSCTDGGYYQGQANDTLTPGVPASLTMNLVKIGGAGNGSLAKISVTISPIAWLTATAVVPLAKRKSD